jgi:hypothetical protein
MEWNSQEVVKLGWIGVKYSQDGVKYSQDGVKYRARMEPESKPKWDQNRVEMEPKQSWNGTKTVEMEPKQLKWNQNSW